MVSNLLVSFGKAILDYFCSNFDEKTEFRLSIDDYTFAECARIAQVDEAELFQALQKQGTLYEDNPLVALAVGAYQEQIPTMKKSASITLSIRLNPFKTL